VPTDKAEEATKIYDEYYDSFQKEKDLKEIIDNILKEHLVLRDSNIKNNESKFAIADYNKHLSRDQFNLDRIFFNKNKEDWDCEEVKLDRFIHFRKVKDKPGKNEHFKEEIPRVTTTEMTINDIYVDKENAESVKCKDDIDNEYIMEGNILLPKTASSFKKVSVADHSLNGGIVNQNLYVIETHEKLVPEFLALFLKSKWGQNQLEIMASGSVISTVNRKNVKNLIIPLPDKDIQEKIIEKVKNQIEKNSLEYYKEKIKSFKRGLI